MKHPINRRFARCAIGVALSAIGAGAWSASPYPSVPVSLSATVEPNVLLVIDTSGSMGSCPDGSGRICTKKIVTARDVANSLVEKNTSLRWGVFSYDGSTAGVLQAPVGSDAATLKGAIDNLTANGLTPLAETLFEVGNYWAGEASYYNKIVGTYTSPIQYRCQKNFNIYITDGASTADDYLPGNSTRECDRFGRNCKDIPTPLVSYPTLNSTGGRVNYNFGICKNDTPINANISCPKKLEGDTLETGFGTNSSRVRSIRDVAAYLYDKDMRYNLPTNDLDGKSWDDPKYPRQNVITYTVGFDIDNSVLNATAIVGRGVYRTASDGDELTKVLNAAVSSIISSTSNAGGVSTSSAAMGAGNQLFQPRYNPKGWYGELLCFDLGATTAVATACANPQATIPVPADRKLFSAKVEGSVTTPFVFNDSTGFGAMTASQKNNLGTTDVIRKEVINFVRGSVVTGYRDRPDGLLGDIIDSQPLVIKAPNGETPDAAYAKFKTDNAGRSMVFIGANDGMLHGFSTSNMAEFFGYVPSSVYPNLAVLGAINYGEGGGSPHAYFVNGALRQQDVKIGSNWQTMLVGGLAQGGQGYFALNATSTSTLAATSGVKWEFTDQHDKDMGYSFGAPIIYTVRTSATTAEPAVIFANGYDADFDDVAVGGKKATTKSSALYIVRASDGVLLKKIEVGGGQGLSSPVGVDFGQDGVLDYVYAGDINGKLWRFDLTSASPGDFKVAPSPIFDAGVSKPITLRPVVYPINRQNILGKQESVGNLILFGTGKLITEGDRTSVAGQSFYAVLDKMEGSPTTVALADLQEQTASIAKVNSGGGYLNGDFRVMSDNPVDLTSASSTKRGWFFDFPDESERLMTVPVIVGTKVLFGTGITKSSERCSPGKGWLMGVNILTGGVVKSTPGNRPYSFLDVRLDDKSNADDRVAGTSSKATYGSGYALDGMPTELTFIATVSKVGTPSLTGGILGSAGASVALGDSNLTGVFTANAASDVSTGNASGRPNGSGSGELFVPIIGDGNLNNGSSVSYKVHEGLDGTGVKLETTLWREIK